MSERYEVLRNTRAISVDDKYLRVMVAYFDLDYLPGAAKRALDLCAELNATEDKKASEKP